MKSFDDVLTLGEKIETIIYSRNDGALGQYLGSSALTFGVCRVDGTTYSVKRSINPLEKWFWKIENTVTGRIWTCEDIYEICLYTEKEAS